MKNSEPNRDVETELYRVAVSPAADVLALIAKGNRTSPFADPAYTDAMRSLGMTPIGILADRSAPADDCCVAFVTGTYGLRQLRVPSMPATQNPDAFWASIRKLCNAMGVSDVLLESFASPEAFAPPEIPRLIRSPRSEYMVDLTQSGLRSRLSRNHKRNIDRAQKLHMRAIRATEADAIDLHVRLVAATMQRRRLRFEPHETDKFAEQLNALMKFGAGEIWQARLGGEVQSSVFLLRSEKSAYYYSAGNSPSAMQSGASSYLVYSILARMTDEGAEQFNLGGAGPDEEGLHRFKKGFAATEIKLMNFHVPLISTPRRMARRLRRKLSSWRLK